MIHHLSFGSDDLDRSRAFYDPLMRELGLRLIKRSDRILAYGLTEVLFSLECPSDGWKGDGRERLARRIPRWPSQHSRRLPQSGDSEWRQLRRTTGHPRAILTRITMPLTCAIQTEIRLRLLHLLRTDRPFFFRYGSGKRRLSRHSECRFVSPAFPKPRKAGPGQRPLTRAQQETAAFLMP
jgi:hypothetical protein